MHRLSGEDAGFLSMELPAQAMNTIAVGTLRTPDGGPTSLTLADIRSHVADRLDQLPSFRWRIVQVPFGLHNPMAVRDPDFDLDFHLREAWLEPGQTLDELFGLENRVGSPENLTKQIHRVELENAKLEAAAALQSAQIRSTHTMCYVLALFCLLLSFTLIACLVTDAQIRNAGLIRDGDLTVTAWACIALIVGSVLASAITFYAIRKERGGKHGVHQV